MSEETATLESVEEIGLQEIFVANKEQDEQPTGVQEIFSVCNGTHTEPGVLAETLDVGDVTTEPNIVSETLHVIAMSEDSTIGSSEAVYVGNDIEDITETAENIASSNVPDLTVTDFDGGQVAKQVMIVTAPTSDPEVSIAAQSTEVNIEPTKLEENVVDISKEGKQFLIVTGQDAMPVPLNIGSLQELQSEESGEPAMKKFRIQGQDGQSFVLTVAAETPSDTYVQLQVPDSKKRTITGGVRGAEKKNQLLQSDVSQAWFTSRDDKTMLQNSGASWKQGQWTKDEVDLLQINISDFCKKHGISDPTEIIFETSKDERKHFYRAIACGLQRPLFSVYRRVLRMYDQKNHIGKYTPEEMAKLRELRARHGNDWSLIGQTMGRSASSVKDKCRLMKDTCNAGKWLADEEKRLTDAVYEFSGSQPGENVVQGLSWSLVAEKVITRSEKQCRTKWLNYLNWKQKGGTDWTREDDMNLILRVVNLGVANDTEIDWNELSKDWKSVRSPQWLRGKWWSLKRHIPDYQILPYSQLLEYMKTYYLNCRIRPVTGSRSVKQENNTDQGLPQYIPIFQMDSVLEETTPTVQAYEVLQQLPEVSSTISGSFVITQPNSSVVQSALSEHIIVQTVPVSQSGSDDDSESQSHIIVTAPGETTQSPGLTSNITLSHQHDLHELTEENVISQTDTLSEDHSSFDTGTLEVQDISESNGVVINIKSEPGSHVLLTPAYVPSSSNSGDIMTSLTDPMLNSDSNSMMEPSSEIDSDKNSDMIPVVNL